MEGASQKNLDDQNQQASEGNPEQTLLINECEVYSQYKPSHLRLGLPHPQTLCEGTGLSCVNPPKITYKLRMNIDWYETSKTGNIPHLSDAQLEAIVYACQSHEEFLVVGETKVRKGFYLGDGTGTGKSRIISGILFEGQRQGISHAVWVTANTGLFETCRNEILHFMPSALFLDAQALRQPIQTGHKVGCMTILFITYKSLITKNTEMLITEWITKKCKNGYIIFDEAHHAKSAHDANIKQSQTGIAVVQLQIANPNARIVYSSATGASEPNHLWYFQRLGLWGNNSVHQTMVEFQSCLEKRGYGGLELLALEMKMSGVFMSRQISYTNVELEYVETTINETFKEVHNRCCDMWTVMIEYLDILKQNAEDDAETAKSIAAIQGPFYASALMFFASINMSSKLSKVERIARKALARNCSVILGLQHTGEAKFNIFRREKKWMKGLPFSNAMYILRLTLLTMGVPVGCTKAYFKNTDKFLKIGKWSVADEKEADKYASTKLDFNSDDEDGASIGVDDIVTGSDSEQRKNLADYESDYFDVKDLPPAKKAKNDTYVFELWPNYSVGMYVGRDSRYPTLFFPKNLSWSINAVKRNVTMKGLARLYHELALFLPINPLDEIIERMANPEKESFKEKESYQVAELTGRKNTNRFNHNEKIWEVCKKDSVKAEMDNFMDLRKRVCIISSIASTGYSLHSDKDRANQQKRVHITLEYSWSPDQLLQQLGRSHRSNQAVVPKYVMISSPVPGEVRYVSILAKRLNQLGAICQGQSKANPLHSRMSDVLCTDLGVRAINSAIAELCKDLKTSELYQTIGLSEITGEKTYFSKSNEDNVSRCFNRCLFLHLDKQQQFLDRVEYEMEKLKNSGYKLQYSPLIEFENTTVDVELLKRYQLKAPQGICELKKFRISRALAETQARQIYETSSGAAFYSRPGEIMLAVDKEDGFVDAYFPFCRNPTTVAKEILLKWKQEAPFNIYGLWDNKVSAIEKNPGCEHKVSKELCAGEDCMRNWGVYEVLILSGFTGICLPAVEGRCKNQIRLAKVCYTENGKETICIGVLIEPSKNKEIEDLLTLRFMLNDA